MWEPWSIGYHLKWPRVKEGLRVNSWNEYSVLMRTCPKRYVKEKREERAIPASGGQSRKLYFLKVAPHQQLTRRAEHAVIAVD